MNPNGNRQLTLGLQLTLALLLFLAILPHATHLRGSVTLFLLGMICYRLLSFKLHFSLGGRWPLLLLTLLGLANVITQYPLLLGRRAGVALLCSMAVLKLMEIKTTRDVYFAVFIGYFILSTQFLFFDHALMVIYVALLVGGLSAVLVEINRVGPTVGVWVPLRTALSMLLQAVPIMVVLFFLFPRFTSPLWNLGPESQQAMSGITDRITPGQLSQLSRSPKVAFRVDFEGAIPAPAQRYWRGPVFSFTDGETWLANKSQSIQKAPDVMGDKPVTYNVTLEPSLGSWLFALEMPSKIPENSRLTGDYQLIRSQPIKRRIRYQATSLLSYRTPDHDQAQLRQALALPANITPRMEQLVAGWKSTSRDPVALVNSALSFFRNQPFYYTLYPPDQGPNPVDGFLFDTRQGFCEHYATGFTLLMRIAGIPARVVGGYQGGEINPVGDYLIVRQSDAHAWSEVWLPGLGWTRVDPTAAVAPERVERSLDIAGTAPTIGLPVLFHDLEDGAFKGTMKHLGFGIDALNNAWHQWVLGYSKERQALLMSMLGLGYFQGPKLAYAMTIAAGFLVAIMIALALKQSYRADDPSQMAYKEFCKKLARYGVVRLPHEGPWDFSRRVIRRRSDLETDVSSITGLYIALRYGEENDPRQSQRLKRLVRSFRP